MISNLRCLRILLFLQQVSHLSRLVVTNRFMNFFASVHHERALADDRFQLSDMRFVKRIAVGSQNPSPIKSEEEIEQAMGLLNRCLTDLPKGVIVGLEKSFSLLNIGEHQVVLQYTVYHVGFSRKPPWLE